MKKEQILTSIQKKLKAPKNQFNNLGLAWGEILKVYP